MPFANLSKKVKRLLKRSTKGHRIRITPFGTNLHKAVGTINPEYSVIHLEDSSTSFVKIEREHEPGKSHDLSSRLYLCD